jgi:hypothetical protein
MTVRTTNQCAYDYICHRYCHELARERIILCCCYVYGFVGNCDWMALAAVSTTPPYRPSRRFGQTTVTVVPSSRPSCLSGHVDVSATPSPDDNDDDRPSRRNLTRIGHAIVSATPSSWSSRRFRYTGVSAMPSLGQVALAAMLPYRRRRRRMIMMMMMIGHALMAKPLLQLTRIGHAVVFPSRLFRHTDVLAMPSRPRRRLSKPPFFATLRYWPCRLGYAVVFPSRRLGHADASAKMPYRQRHHRMIMMMIGQAAVMAKPSLQLTRIGQTAVSATPSYFQSAFSATLRYRPCRRLGHTVVLATMSSRSRIRLGHDVVSFTALLDGDGDDDNDDDDRSCHRIGQTVAAARRRLGQAALAAMLPYRQRRRLGHDVSITNSFRPRRRRMMMMIMMMIGRAVVSLEPSPRFTHAAESSKPSVSATLLHLVKRHKKSRSCSSD